MGIKTTLDELLSEDVSSAINRQSKLFSRLRDAAGGNVVLYGAGQLGRKAAVVLRRNGVIPCAFADNNPNLAGKRIDGIEVMTPEIAAERHKDSALFVASIFLPTGGGIGSRIEELLRLNCRWVTHFLALGWYYDGILPHFAAERPSNLLKFSNELRKVAGYWADDLSVRTFEQQLTWRLRGDFTTPMPPSPCQYFPSDILIPNSREYFVDGGAYDGDTLRNAPWNFEKVIAIEPDPLNARKLASVNCQDLKVFQVLLGKTAGFASFKCTGTMASARDPNGTATIAVMTVDELTGGDTPTFLKLDVEGDELAALKGARSMLARSQPVVAVCAYHRPEDIWAIPEYLHEILPSHRLYFRSHAWDGFESVIYAVPLDRCANYQ